MMSESERAEFLLECETKFATRYTDQDSEYKRITGPNGRLPPPAIPDWPSERPRFQNRNQNYQNDRRRGDRNDSWSDNRGRNSRNYDGNRGERGYQGQGRDNNYDNRNSDRRQNYRERDERPYRGQGDRHSGGREQYGNGGGNRDRYSDRERDHQGERRRH